MSNEVYVNDVNNPATNSMKSDLGMIKVYLRCAAIKAAKAYGPKEYSDLYVDRIEKIFKEIEGMYTTVDTAKGTLIDNQEYTDCCNEKGVWLC